MSDNKIFLKKTTHEIQFSSCSLKSSKKKKNITEKALSYNFYNLQVKAAGQISV